MSHPVPASPLSDDEIVTRLRAIAQPTRQMAADRIERLAAENARLRHAVRAADRGFEAALAENWLDVIASGFAGDIASLWQRHLTPARHALAEAIAGHGLDPIEAAHDRMAALLVRLAAEEVISVTAAAAAIGTDGETITKRIDDLLAAMEDAESDASEGRADG